MSAWAATKSRSDRSFSVRGESCKTVLGKFNPFSGRSLLPFGRAWVTCSKSPGWPLASGYWVSITWVRILPSSM